MLVLRTVHFSHTSCPFAIFLLSLQAIQGVSVNTTENHPRPI